MPTFFNPPQETHPERLWPLNNGCRGRVLDLGCGAHKTDPSFTGVDIQAVTDVCASLNKLPFEDGSFDCLVSRHSLEHMLDPMATLQEWLRVLKPGGRMYIILPDHEFINTIDPFYSNGEHLHAYTRASFRNLVDLIPDLYLLDVETVVPEWSFGAVLRKGLPTISVILPHLSEVDGVKLEHREAGLKRCLASIEAQNYPQDLIDVQVIDGEGTVPEKVKHGVGQTKGDYIIYAANDMEFAPDAFRLAVMESECQDKALVSFNEGPVYPDEGNICTHFLIRRDFIPKLERSEIFDTRYFHLGVDNILWARAKKLGQAYHSERAKITHNHFTKGSEFDSVYAKAWNSERVKHDRDLLAQDLKELYADQENID